MRKKAVGLLGNAKGAAKPIPFAEDTCVPPEHLADYIVEFRALLDSHGLSYGMFGHVDAGVLHVRPALDMCDPQQEILMKQISDDVVALPPNTAACCGASTAKVSAPNTARVLRRAALRGAAQSESGVSTRITASTRVRSARQRRGRADAAGGCGEARHLRPANPDAVRSSWRGAMECNGNGLCFNFDVKSPMCPSMKITSNRIHSPKGRATLVREWLRLLADRGVDPLKLEQELPEKRASLRSLIERTRNSWHARKGEYDFSHEVKEAMSGCLACKACSTQCPIKIDVPEFRSRFLQLYHTRYRPVRDHLVATVESYAPLMARAPKDLQLLYQPAAGTQALRKAYRHGRSAAAVGAVAAAPAGRASFGEHDPGTAGSARAEQKAKPCWWCRIRSPATTMRRWWPTLSVWSKSWVISRCCCRSRRTARRSTLKAS
jgi:ferredoxin